MLSARLIASSRLRGVSEVCWDTLGFVGINNEIDVGSSVDQPSVDFV